MFMFENILHHYCHFPQNLIRCILQCLLLYCYWILLFLGFVWIFVRFCIRYSSHLIFIPSLHCMVWVEFIYGTSFFTNSQTIFKMFYAQAVTEVCFYPVHSTKNPFKFGICKWCDRKDFYRFLHFHWKIIFFRYQDDLIVLCSLFLFHNSTLSNPQLRSYIFIFTLIN